MASCLPMHVQGGASAREIILRVDGSPSLSSEKHEVNGGDDEWSEYGTSFDDSRMLALPGPTVEPPSEPAFVQLPQWAEVFEHAANMRVLSPEDLSFLDCFRSEEDWSDSQFIVGCYDWATFPAGSPTCYLYYYGGNPGHKPGPRAKAYFRRLQRIYKSKETYGPTHLGKPRSLPRFNITWLEDPQ